MNFRSIARAKFGFQQLSKGQAEFYKQNGYLIIENIVSKSDIQALIQRTDQLIERSDIIEKQIYFGSNMQKGMNFLETASQIGFLMENGMIDEKGKLKVKDKKLALNKIGHAMHDLDDIFERFSYTKSFANVLRGLDYVDPLLVQSMLIFKNPKFGTPVDMHTDNTYIISEPRLSCVGFWIALQDATKENGCMYGYPGSHRTPTTYFAKLNKERNGTEYQGPVPEYEKKFRVEDATCLAVPEGSLICLHGDLVHFSTHNHSQIPRHAYTMHFFEQYKNRWSPDAWLQRIPSLPFRHYYQRVDELTRS